MSIPMPPISQSTPAHPAWPRILVMLWDKSGGQGGIAKTRLGVFSSSSRRPRIASQRLGAQNAFGVLSNMGSHPTAPHQQKSPAWGFLLMADRVGFEPTRRFPVHTLSKRAPSAARPPVQNRRDYSGSHPSRKRDSPPRRFDLQFGV